MKWLLSFLAVAWGKRPRGSEAVKTIVTYGAIVLADIASNLHILHPGQIQDKK